MKLREIQIDGFGIFANARIRGFTSGINVLYGQNEFGKTTLLEFIRRILFGFPMKSSPLNPYPPLRGGKYGGHLVCHMNDAALPELTVTRTTGKGGGTLTISTPDGKNIGESQFASMLGHVSDELYRNVFAVSLQELQAAKQLQGEELRNRIYGAGLGLGQVSITDLKKSFSDTAERLYKPRGSNQTMNDLASRLIAIEKQIRDTSNEFGRYDAKKAERDQRATDASQLRERQRVLQAEQRSLDNQRSLYETFVGLQVAQDELAPLAATPDIPDAGIEDLRKKQQAIAALETRLQETRARRAAQQLELEALQFDPALLEHESDIKTLSRSLTQYRDAQRDLPLLNREQALALEQVDRGIRELGGSWNVETVRTYALTGEQADALRRQETGLHAQEKASEKAQDRLDDYRNQTRAARARPSLPLIYRIIGLAVLGLGAAGCLLSVHAGDIELAVLSGVVGALGLVIALSLGSSSGPLSDKAVRELEAEAAETARLLAVAQDTWKSLLMSLELSPSLSPEAVGDQIRAVRALQGELRTIDDRRNRITDMHSVVQTTVNRFTTLAAALSETIPGADVSFGIEAVDARLDAAQELRVKRDSLRRDMARTEAGASSLAGQLADEKAGLDALLAGFGVTSVDEFVALHQCATRARELRADIARRTLAIQSAVGVGAQFDSFIATLAATDPETHTHSPYRRAR